MVEEIIKKFGLDLVGISFINNNIDFVIIRAKHKEINVLYLDVMELAIRDIEKNISKILFCCKVTCAKNDGLYIKLSFMRTPQIFTSKNVINNVKGILYSLKCNNILEKLLICNVNKYECMLTIIYCYINYELFEKYLNMFFIDEKIDSKIDVMPIIKLKFNRI